MGVTKHACQFFITQYDVGYELFIHNLFHVEQFHCVLIIENLFNHERMLHFIKCFFGINYDNGVFFLFFSTSLLYYFHWVLCFAFTLACIPAQIPFDHSV